MYLATTQLYYILYSADFLQYNIVMDRAERIFCESNFCGS